MKNRKFRLAGWLAVGGLLGGALLVPSAALANDLHQTPPISWDDAGFQGSAGDCEGADLEPGEVLWHFVHTEHQDRATCPRPSTPISARAPRAGTAT